MEKPKPAFAPAITGLPSYLAARQAIITSREGFFQALRMHLRPEQRPDAKDLNDPLWNSPGRQIPDEEWISNPARGYLTIRESAYRPFRLAVLQMGQTLRIGVRVNRVVAANQPWATSRIAATFATIQPVQLRLSSGDVLFDWTFDMPDLYDSALAMETAIHRAAALFENALHAILQIEEHSL